MSSGRVRRIADRIQVIVAEMLERRIKDARLGFVTVTDVRVTGDSQHASIFYTVLGDEDERSASTAALESAKGLIRSEVGKQLGMRHTPTLEFILDALPDTAAHIEELLAKARDDDAAVAAAAAQATYAGEADPYKHPDEPVEPDDDGDPDAVTSASRRGGVDDPEPDTTTPTFASSSATSSGDVDDVGSVGAPPTFDATPIVSRGDSDTDGRT